MPVYEYKVVPAPAKGEKAKTAKTPESRFALAVETMLNTMGAQGWEFQRSELLPSEERSGLTGSQTVWRNVMVFRRALPQAETAAEPAAEFAMLRVPVATPPVGQGTVLGPANAPEPPTTTPPTAPPVTIEREEPRAPGTGIDRVAVKMASASGLKSAVTRPEDVGPEETGDTDPGAEDETGTAAGQDTPPTEEESQPKP